MGRFASLFNFLLNLTILVGYIYKSHKITLMKLNTKSRYAVMALADLAKFSSQNPVSLRDISLRQNISTTTLLFIVPPYCGCGCKTNAIGEVFFLLLKYFASSLPAGPGIKISTILLSINVNDNYSHKKCLYNNHGTICESF